MSGKVNTAKSIINLSKKKSVTQSSIKNIFINMPQMLILNDPLRVQNDVNKNNKKCLNHNECLSIHFFYTTTVKFHHFFSQHPEKKIQLIWKKNGGGEKWRAITLPSLCFSSIKWRKMKNIWPIERVQVWEGVIYR